MSNTKDEPNIEVMPISPQIVSAAWCVECLPELNYSELIYKGNSLCREHFNKKYENR